MSKQVQTRANPPGFGYVDPNFPNPGGPNDTAIIIYGYTPSFALAVFAAVFFLATLVVHLFQVLRHRTWYFVTLPIGLAFEVVGYIARSLSAKQNPYNLIYFIIQYFFIVTAPVFIAAGIYTVLSALLSRVPAAHRRFPLSPRIVIWFFVASDVISTVVQIAGAALIGVKESRRQDATVANNILLGGLAYQVFTLGVFLLLVTLFLVRNARWLNSFTSVTFCVVFVAATVLIYLRTCFRLAETAQGLGGALYKNEVLFGCLEFAPVALAVLLFVVWHPGRCVGSKLRSSI